VTFETDFASLSETVAAQSDDLIGFTGAATAGAAMRIVIVMHDFAAGGTEHVAVRLANSWAACGRRVTIFCGTERGPLRSRVSKDVRVARSPRDCPRSLFSRLALAEALADFTAIEWPDVVYAPGNFHLPVLARFSAIDPSRAVTIGKLSNPIASSSPIGPFRRIHEAVTRRFLGRVDRFVAMSPALRAEARTIFNAERVALAWEPLLDPTPPSADACRGAAHPLFLAVGRLERQKNFALAVKALALSGHGDAELLFLGDGSERKKLARLAARLGVADRVTFAGYKSDISHVFASASALLLPSRFEGYPAVAAEAVAAGLPVIATPCSPAIGEILVNDDHSRIVSPSPRAFAAAMDDMTTRPPSDRRPRASFVARHDATIAAAKYLALLDELCVSARSPVRAEAAENNPTRRRFS